ncbi:2-hydroxymuconate tautomerase [Aquaspirillum serpens]|uniref:2-hydroxymuconate tautomerase n=1 Tax=Aquaspirillum serpens TaxID=190 RepID=UPI0003B5BFCE|nr:2-hydroxymuconate tautomerase [Aquaspirillum serpens]
MPIAEVHLLEGRTVEQKRKLIAEMTRAISESVDVKPEQVRVIIHEMPKEHFGIGGVSAKDLGR